MYVYVYVRTCTCRCRLARLYVSFKMATSCGVVIEGAGGVVIPEEENLTDFKVFVRPICLPGVLRDLVGGIK